MFCRGREEGLEFAEDETCINVDVSSDCEERDASVLDSKGGDVGTRHYWWLGLYSIRIGICGYMVRGDVRIVYMGFVVD